MSELRELIDSVGVLFGVNLRLLRPGDSRNSFVLRINELPEPFGLAIRVQQNPLTWQSITELDRLAGEVIQSVKSRFLETPEELAHLLEVGSQSLGHLELQVNKVELSKVDSEATWSSLLLITKSKKADTEPISTLRDFLIATVGSALDIFTERFADDLEGEHEGHSEIRTYNRYERSSVNRSLCLAAKGTACAACGLDPGRHYGIDSASLIHVHHLTPLSMMGGSAVVNPERDLIPLCPTCHNVAHKRQPPFTPEEISSMISGAGED